MHPLAVLAALPTPTTSPGFDENTVTPGVQGFFAIFLLAAAVVLLAVSMVRRIRRVRYREEVRLRLEAEAAAEGDAPRGDRQG